MNTGTHPHIPSCRIAIFSCGQRCRNLTFLETKKKNKNVSRGMCQKHFTAVTPFKIGNERDLCYWVPYSDVSKIVQYSQPRWNYCWVPLPWTELTETASLLHFRQRMQRRGQQPLLSASIEEHRPSPALPPPSRATCADAVYLLFLTALPGKEGHPRFFRAWTVSSLWHRRFYPTACVAGCRWHRTICSSICFKFH